jgi:hypothetical protein
MRYPRRRIRKWEKPISKNKGREAQHLGDFSLVKTIVAIIEEKCNIGIFKIPIDKFVKGVLSVLQAPFCLSSEKVPRQQPNQRLPCLSERLKLHLITQTGELANEAFLRSFTIPFLKEGFPFLQIGGLVTEKVIDNDQDTVSDSDGSSFGPAPFGDSAIVFSQIAMLLMRGRMSSLHKQAS